MLTRELVMTRKHSEW